MAYKSLITCFLLVFVVFSGCQSARAKLTIQSQTAVKIELSGFNILDENALFKGDLAAGSNYEIDPPYRGLALLVFGGGQSYPVIIGAESFTLKITGPHVLPSFVGSGENDFFYKLLAGGDPAPEPYDFAFLMLQAKELLESSHSIKTVKELAAKKKEFYGFVGKHYQSLKHSDMIRRLIGQYFMMHEYIDYHVAGTPAAAIQLKYQQEVVSGVGSWLEILRPYLSEQEILNYCVSLYYKRSMVTLAALIVENFKDIAYCPGEAMDAFRFSGDIHLAEVDGYQELKLADFKGDKLIAFVSDDCPVSMVATVSKARNLAREKEALPVIVAPLQKLSDKHLAMRSMISSRNMFFIDDEKWRHDNLVNKIKLPLVIRAGNEFAKKPGGN